MNDSIVYLGLSVIILFLITMIFIRRNEKEIERLNKTVNTLKADFNREIKKVKNQYAHDIEQLEGSINVKTYNIEKNEKSLSELETRVGCLEDQNNLIVKSHLNSINESLKGILDIMDEEHQNVMKWRSENQTKPLCDVNIDLDDLGDDNEPYADIPGDLADGLDGEESATDEQREALEYADKKMRDKSVYKWVFPSEDDGSEWPITGEEYLVVGRLKGTDDVASGIGVWSNSFIGFKLDDGRRFDKNYAYIRLPSPSDVMTKVLDIQFKEHMKGNGKKE